MDKQLPVVECFTSFQGEGARVGTPTVFIRLAGCNLKCEWCDTKYASQSPEFELMTPREVVSKIFDEVVSVRTPYDICITGGEPLLYPEGVEELIRLLVNLKFPLQRIVIQTNGTIQVKRNSLIAKTYLAVSPKPPNYVIHPIPSEIKLVVLETHTSDDVAGLVNEWLTQYKCPIYLQPVTIDNVVSMKSLRTATLSIGLIKSDNLLARVSLLPQVHRLLQWR